MASKQRNMQSNNLAGRGIAPGPNHCRRRAGGRRVKSQHSTFLETICDTDSKRQMFRRDPVSFRVSFRRPRKDHRGVDLISDALPFGGLWYAGPEAASNAIDYAKFRSRSHDAVIRVYDDAGKLI